MKKSKKLSRANHLFSKGVNAYQRGDLKVARKAFMASLSEFQSLIDQGREDLRPELALTRMNLGCCLSEFGALSEAQQVYEVVLSEIQSLIDQGREELRPDLAKTRMNLGVCLRELGALSEAKQVCEAAQNEYQGLIDQGRDDLRPDLALTRMNLGVYLNDIGALPEAQRVLETAQGEYQGLIDQGRDELRPELAKTRMNFGNCLSKLGLLSEAKQVCEMAQSEYQGLVDQGRDDLRPDLARTRMNLGGYLNDIGALSEAQQVYEVAQSELQGLIEQGREDLRPDLARTHLNLGICLNNSSALSEAQQVFEMAQSEFQGLIEQQGRDELRLELAITRMNLGNCLRQLGAEAQQVFEMAQSEFQGLIDQGRDDLRPQLARTRLNLGICLNNIDAKPVYEKAQSEYQSLIDQGRDELRLELAATHMNSGLCFSELGELSAADNHYQTSLALLQKLQATGQLSPDIISMMRVIADWHRQRSDNPRALELAMLGLDWLDTLLNRIYDATKGSLLEQNIALFHLATDLALELNQADQAYLILERSKSRVLVEQMLRERAEPSPQVDENLRTQYHQLRERLRQLVNQLAPPPDNRKGDTRFFTPTFRNSERSPEQEAQLLEAQKEVEQKLAKVRAAIAEQDPAYGDAIQPRLLKTEQIATLIPANTLAIAFEQRPDYLLLYPITAQGVHTPLQVDLNQQALWERVETFRKNIVPEDISEWLTDKLATVLNQLLEQHKPQEILFIPHQHWHLLPLHLTQIEEQALALRYPVRYIPSLQVLRLIHEREQANPDDPKAGLILADGDDHQAKELFTSVRFQNARIVILTAQIQATDEYIGLISGFLFAGAHNVLAALWTVDPASTHLLTEDFHQGLADGLPPPNALQQAQRQLREMDRKTVQERLQLEEEPLEISPYKEPYYWAGFVLVGDGI
ncbi:MAG: CHAT domain-containing protein [Pseudomonadota bacterium]